MPYVTVFDISQKPFEWWWSASGLLFVVIGILLIRFGTKLGAAREQKILGWAMVIFASFWTLVSFGFMYSSYREYAEAYRTGQYSVVEGIVEGFHPMPYEGHQEECFVVQKEKFCYSDYDVSKPGFHQTASHGGPIRAGLPVRIAYRDGRILRLEIGAGSMSSEAERLAHSKEEKERWERRLKELESRHSTIYFVIAIIFAAVANGCAFFVLHRMKTLGRNVGHWRWASKDIALYKEYWKLAPMKKWSRAPLIVGIACFIFAVYFLFHTFSR
jgi:hypothetical protein